LYGATVNADGVRSQPPCQEHEMLREIINIIKEKHLRLVILGSITVVCRNGELDKK
jgi:hypothetical protein